MNETLADNASGALCELVGPFETLSGAEDFTQRLSSIDIESKVQSIELPAGKSYWVHLLPEPSSEEAYRKLADLQSQNIESYVIRKGDLENAISLGVFTYEELAMRKLESLKRKGLDAKLREVQRTQTEIWVEISPGEAEKMSTLTWERMLNGLSSQERRQNFCLDVAS